LAAADCFAPLEIVECFDRHGVPDIGNLDMRRQAADPSEFRCVVMDVVGAEDLFFGNVLQRHGNRRAVRGRAAVDEVRRRDAEGSRMWRQPPGISGKWRPIWRTSMRR